MTSGGTSAGRTGIHAPAWMIRWLTFASTLIAAAVLAGAPALAHPAPFSYLDINYENGGIDGSLTMHVIDVAHDLGLAHPEQLYDPKALQALEPAITAKLDQGIDLTASGHPLKLQWTGIQTIPAQQQVKLTYRIADQRPAALTVRTDLFRYDRLHQTFANLYLDGSLRQQWIFARGAPARTYYFGSTAAGAAEVMKTFIPAGIHHILIGPDHILFLCALLLMGGSWKTLLKIVTAFTLGHSLTLSLATLGVVSPPASLVEPAIALTIIVVGADNLLRGKEKADLRPFAALLFGLVHGFGFASVLREFGLPREALAWSLFSFNVGVELGQLAIVAVVATGLELVRRQSQAIGYRVSYAGSILVIAAGAFWFVQRVFFPGGVS